MHLVIAPRRRLADRYGHDYPALADALDAALAARTAAGVPTLAFDPQDGIAQLGVAPAGLEPPAVVAQLRTAEAALARRGAIIESLWIVGGPAALPFGRLPNPMPDRDAALLSDCVYGMADASQLLVRWPVGRTPDADPPVPGLLAGLLGRVADAHTAGPQPPGALRVIAAARWAAVTADILGLAGVESSLVLAPGDDGRAALAGARVIYCNLHGVRGAADWFGQPANDSDLTPAIRLADLPGVDLRGAAVVSQACFGARLEAPGDQSLALGLLGAGADAVVAPLGLSYGAFEPPPGESDLLAAALIGALHAPLSRLGEAFQAANAAALRLIIQHRGAPDAVDVKTLLGFLLYGDPALAWTA